MHISDLFLPMTSDEKIPGPTQCLLLVSGRAVVVERAEKEEFIRRAVDEGRVICDPENMTITAVIP